MIGGVSVTEDLVSQVEMPKPQTEDRESRLRWINRLLKSSASSEQQTSNQNGRHNNGSHNNYNHRNQHVCLSATMNDSSDSAGVFVVADRDLDEGTMVLSCESEGFVLETPEHRRNYCSYCSRKKHDALPLMFCLNCLDRDGNPMVGYCSDCTHLHKRHHIDNPIECRVLQCLRATITGYDNSDDEEEDERTTATNQCVTEIFRSSVALLAIKLVARQIQVTTASTTTTTTLQENGNTTANHNSNNHSSTDEPSSSSSTWLDRFQLLYEHPLPDQGPYSAISTLLSAALDAVVDTTTLGQTSNKVCYKDLIRSTLGRILGCSHAIVDPSLPLGRQTTGRAIYACHSFYNHSCTPNAYLSSIHPQTLPSNNNNNNANNNNSNNNNNNDTTNDCPIICSPQGLTARVHLLRPVARGEEITLSYIPLSGLSLQERKEILQNSYGFSCSCSACSDKNHPLVLPSNTVVADIDAIRQIQFGLNDKLHDLSNKWIKDLRYSIIRKEHERIRRRMRRSEAKEVPEKKDPGMVLQMDRILRRIEMTQKGIANQNLPECHEVSIEADRLSAAACDLWLKAMGESLCVSVESAFEAHFEFWRKTEQIQGLFDPVALGTQCLASSVSCILRAKEKQKKRQLLLQQQEEERKKAENDKNNSNDDTNGNNNNTNNNNNNNNNDTTNHQEEDLHHGDENDEGNDNCEEEMQLSQSERKRGLKLLSTCLGSDHPWVYKLKTDATATAQGLLVTAHDNDKKPAASPVAPNGRKRRRTL